MLDEILLKSATLSNINQLLKKSIKNIISRDNPDKLSVFNILVAVKLAAKSFS